jgi:hypothetical protein
VVFDRYYKSEDDELEEAGTAQPARATAQLSLGL